MSSFGLPQRVIDDPLYQEWFTKIKDRHNLSDDVTSKIAAGIYTHMLVVKSIERKLFDDKENLPPSATRKLNKNVMLLHYYVFRAYELALILRPTANVEQAGMEYVEEA
jgi:hypothetical protein